MRTLGLVAVVCGVLAMAACGGGGGGSNGNSTITSVTVNCSPTNVQAGQTSQCNATVTGTGSFSNGVSWGASAGSINSSGVFTAPATNTSIQVTITATSTQDTSKSGSTTLTVNPATVSTVTATCSPSTIASAQTSQCTAQVNGVNSTAVTWSASSGTINSSGLFTAPTTNTSIQVTITATSTQDTTKSGTAIVTVNPATNNVLAIVVDAGPTGNYVNGAFATATVCVPGTATCKTIDHLLVDTGSSGLRIMDSVLGITLPQQTDASGHPVAECAQFADGFSWGAIATADIQLAGEKTGNVPNATFTGVPVQVIGTSTFPNIPSSCSSTGTAENDVQSLGANGILGVGLYQQDCGTYCTNTIDPSVPFYYTCSGGTCTQAEVSITNQVQNPVWLFPQDNNGVLIQLPSVPQGTGTANLAGSLIFGIDSQADNALGSASFYTTTADGNFQKVTFNGKDYVNNCGASNNAVCLYPDSGSNALFILDAATLGVSQCTGGNSSFYCQNPTKAFTATNFGANGTNAAINFSIGDANSLFNNNPSSTAFVELGGPNPGSFDYGLPFFYGRPVFTVIETKTTSKGTGPAWAY